MIAHLGPDTHADPAVLGGKGCGLVRLMRAGFLVPETWCVPAASPADQESEESDLRGELEELWTEVVAHNPDAALAVRSSATAEDLASASFAGIYTTHLGIDSPESLVDAVRACRTALKSDAALRYRDARGVTGEPAMAVVIQVMVPADASGVLLTANPIRPFAQEIVIDAAYGLGESVASGRTDPDHITVDTRTGSIRDERVGTKQLAIRYLRGTGTVETTVPDSDQVRRCLDDDQLRRLAALAAGIEDRIGERRDCEWAFAGDDLYVLQDRPITGLPPRRPREVWSRRFGDEYLADYSLPLSYTLMGRWISDYALIEPLRLMGRTDLDDVEPMRLYNGYSYVSGRYVARLLQSVPPSARGRQATGWFTPLWVDEIQAEPFVPRYLLGLLLAPWRDRRRGTMRRNLGALQRHCAAIEAQIVPKLQQDYTAIDDAEWLLQTDEVDRLGIEHFRVIRWGMAYYNPMLHGTLQDLAARWAADTDGELYQDIVSGLPETRTARMNRHVFELGVLARQDAALAAGCRSGLAEAELRARAPNERFWQAFDAFSARYGHRSDSRDISRPRWAETPDVILGLVRAQLQAATTSPDPTELEAKAVQRSEDATRTALARGRRGPAGPMRWLVLRWLIRETRTFTAYRENQRYHLDYLLAHLRKLVLERGRRLVAAGALADPFEVFFLEADEVAGLVDRPRVDAALRQRIDARAEHYRLWKDRLPATYLFDDVETEGELVEGDPADSAGATGKVGDRDLGAGGSGIGASRGVAAGPVSLIRASGQLDSVEPGDILVAANIDPGWTSVFPLIAGVVTETGGLLSHGALLAREYGIPAVMGVTGALGRFTPGTRLRIDGTRGTITIQGTPREQTPSDNRREPRK